MQNGGDVDEERCLREVSAGAHTAKVLSYTRTRYDPNYPPSPEAKCCDRGISYFGAQLAVLDEAIWKELMGLRVGIRIVQKCPGPIVQSDLSGTDTVRCSPNIGQDQGTFRNAVPIVLVVLD